MGRWFEPKPRRVRHSHVETKWVGASETSGEELWSSVCMSESLRLCSWENEIQLNRKLPTLSGEMWES